MTALFVAPAGEEPLTGLYAELTGEPRPFAEVAHEAKLEVARTTFAQEFDRLRALLPQDGLEEAAAALHIVLPDGQTIFFFAGGHFYRAHPPEFDPQPVPGLQVSDGQEVLLYWVYP